MPAETHRHQALQQSQTIASSSQTTTIPGPSVAPNALSDANRQPADPPVAILRLRGAQSRDNRNVQWAENVVDNEGLNRKKSKVCCIYHRPRAVDESSDSSSSSDSDSNSSCDSDSDGGLAVRGDADHAFRNRLGNASSNSRRGTSHRHAPDCPEHAHDHAHESGHGLDNSDKDGQDDDDADDEGRGLNSSSRGKGKEKAKEKRKPSPNAYEKVPRYNKPGKS